MVDIFLLFHVLDVFHILHVLPTYSNSPIRDDRIPQFVERCQVRYHIGDLEVSLTHQQYYNHNLAVLQFVS